MVFRPTEVLFCPTADCNLSCAHCATPKSPKKLPVKTAGGFLSQCKATGIKRVSFTGGEPFLTPEFLYRLSSMVVAQNLLFGRIMTNGVWYKDKRSLRSILEKLRDAGYDGDICVSVDAFHAQDIRKLAIFIETATSVWRRPDVVSIAWVGGDREARTMQKIRKLLAMLKKLPIRTTKIELAPVGGVSAPKGLWGKKWFKEDHCRGPGNVLFVTPDGDVKPCCGYANDLEALTIGNIKKDSAIKIIKSGNNNGFSSVVFTKGLSGIRKKLESLGAVFPGKTKNHCFFCYHILTKIPKKMLHKALIALRPAVLGIILSGIIASPSYSETQTLKKSDDYGDLDIKIIRSITIPEWYHEGLLLDGDSIWVANGRGGNIWIIDKASGNLEAEIVPPSGFTEAIIKAGDGRYLITDWDDKKLYEASLKDGRLAASRTLFDFTPSHPAGLVSADGRLFVIIWTRGIGTKFDILELDGEFRVIDKIRVTAIQEPAHMAWDGKSLWITGWYNRRVYRVDPEKWAVTASFRAPISKVTGIACEDKYLWITGTYADLYKVSVD